MAGNVELNSVNSTEGDLNISPEVSDASDDTAGAVFKALLRANSTLAGILSMIGKNNNPSEIIDALDYGRKEVGRIVPKAANDDNLPEDIKKRA